MQLAVTRSLGALWLLCCVVATPAQGSPTTKPVVSAETIQFSAKLVRAPKLPSSADADRRVWVVGVDPRWLIVVHVEAVGSGKPPFGVGTEQGFLVHSPTRVFCGSSPKVGRLYSWKATLSRAADGTPRFLMLDACGTPRQR